MTCDEVKTMLAGYADGELSPIETDAVEVHLAGCGRCRQVVHDQHRMQHVVGSYAPPGVSDQRWNEIGRRLRAELEGTGEPIVLKTRSRIEALDPTPMPQQAVGREETGGGGRPPREAPAPRARPRAAHPVSAPPSLTVMRVRTRKARRAPFGWVAHVAGALAAGLIIAMGLAALWQGAAPPLEPDSLARQDDVAIMEVQMTDPDYSVVVSAGDEADAAAVWVVPSETSG